jgi:hypothetical protein
MKSARTSNDFLLFFLEDMTTSQIPVWKIYAVRKTKETADASLSDKYIKSTGTLLHEGIFPLLERDITYLNDKYGCHLPLSILHAKNG